MSPALSNLSETSNTLRYAARAKKIKTKPIVVMVSIWVTGYFAPQYLTYSMKSKKLGDQTYHSSDLQDPREALIVSLKREVNILHQENNHLRQLLELADSDGAMSVLPQESSAAVMAQLGMDKNGAKEPLDGRGRAAVNLSFPLLYSTPHLGHLGAFVAEFDFC